MVPVVIEQPARAGLIDQLMPDPPGNASVNVTDFATPGPALETVIVNPIGVPALTDGASAVLVIDRFGHCTVTEAVAGGTVGLLVAATVAVFG
jgi:hypothetical protein